METNIEELVPELRGWTDARETNVQRHQGVHFALVRALARQSARLSRRFGYDSVRAGVDGEGDVRLEDLESMHAWFAGRVEVVTAQVLRGARAVGMSDRIRRDHRFERWIWERTWARERGRMLEWFTFLAQAGRQLGPAREPVLRCDRDAAPLAIRGPGGPCFLWFQPEVVEPTLGTKLRPDFAWTETPEAPSHANLIGTIECKSTDNCRAELVREVWAKMKLLNVSHATLVVDGTLSPSSRNACERGGIDVVAAVLDTARLERVEASNDCAAFEELADRLEDSARRRNFGESEEARGRDRRAREARSYRW